MSTSKTRKMCNMTPRRCQITILTLPSWSVEEMRSNDVYFWCVCVIFRKKCNMTPWDQNSEIWPPSKKSLRKTEPITRLKTGQNILILFFGKKKSVFQLIPVISGYDRKSKSDPNTFFPLSYAEEFKAIAGLQRFNFKIRPPPKKTDLRIRCE